MEESLFPESPEEKEKKVDILAPLAERLRPRCLDELLGQEHILGPGKLLRRAIEQDEVQSLILWGPPGSGKTTIARIIASMTNSFFLSFSAVISGIKEIKEIMKQAEYQKRHYHRRTILFIDEIHRFNKAQQDAFLPYVERGDIILIGSTTENPSFEIISPLLSRSKVFRLQELSEEDLITILNRALEDKERGLKGFYPLIEPELLRQIAVYANGDARVALNTLEIAAMNTPPDKKEGRRITAAVVEDAMQKRLLLYDKKGEEHYNIISALHKSMRNSDPDASLYWLARMLEAGEDPLYIARRIVRFASED
ncbi:MAG: replication-associated recombination protein A, partial [Candidatus Aminicenantes bacterium]|nr:replication-associated recombination protein A [Candidatus Aminicenantes bacterium]